MPAYLGNGLPTAGMVLESTSALKLIVTGVFLGFCVQNVVLPLVSSIFKWLKKAGTVTYQGGDASPSQAQRQRQPVASDTILYGLDHGKLNIDLPPKSMWMNMGFWRDTEDFPTACGALLREVLHEACLLENWSDKPGIDQCQANCGLSILDLGFGCGDQTLALLNVTRDTSLKYVGVTLNSTQCELAQRRVHTAINSLQEETGTKSHKAHLFCADAANPSSWPAGLTAAMNDLVKSYRTEDDMEEPWVLALDTLYHFTPSRLPILTYAATQFNANLMAFDILLSDSATLFQRTMLQIAAVASGCPRKAAFLTESRYRELLAEAGFDAGETDIVDVTEHVFGPLSKFLALRERQLGSIGLRLGSLKVAGYLFGWWARSKVVRGVIVIARKPF